MEVPRATYRHVGRPMLHRFIQDEVLNAIPLSLTRPFP